MTIESVRKTLEEEIIEKFDKPRQEELFVIVPIHFVYEELRETLHEKRQVISERELMQMNHSCLGELIDGHETLNRKLYNCTKDHIK